jgi:hypothetical protein
MTTTTTPAARLRGPLTTRAVRVLAGLLLLAGAGVGMAAPAAHADTVQTHLSILKCQFSDDTTHAVPGSPLNTDTQIADFLTGTGTDGIPDYYRQASDGQLLLDGTINGWYTMPTTRAADPTISRRQRMQDCIDTAQNAGWSLPAGNLLVVFRNQCTDRGPVLPRSWVLLDPCSSFTQAARDIGYTAGRLRASGSDPWSLTTTGTVFTQPSRWGPRPVGPNGYQLSTSNVSPQSWPDRTAGQVTLAPLYGAAGTTLPRVVILPSYHPSSGRSLVIEYRLPQGMDAPIGAPVVLLHETDGISTTLLRAADGSPLQHLVAGTTSVHVVSTGGPTATVSIDTGYGLPRVPDVIGVPRVDAGRTVQAAGLAVSYNASPVPTCDQLGQVVAQVPDPGTIVDPGSRVILTIATKAAKACPLE